ncbi:conjugal transfer protein TraC [Candidatus Azambacteria bacterium RBG_16_47_10]|uniref:Conjugal transfer protein TraC n=1 Tax=Candidatus Azambacteria bacterium RBG_16_47_10 TaxID=1797292 RepID=A0A1F5AYR1_9BACT|nr:MAG: conjugal transfer protein TraC [Candidatus Azambacteria bacterium RBG_16_47_10]
MALFDRQEKDIRLPSASTAAGFKDIVAPSAVLIDSRYLQLGDKFLRTIFLYSYPRYLNTNWFSPVINLDRFFDVAIHFHPVDTATIMKRLNRKVTAVEAQLAEREEKGLIRDPILETAIHDLEDLRNSLQQATQKLFRLGVYVTLIENSVEQLDKAENEIKGILDARMVLTKAASFQQEIGFMSTLPLGQDRLEIHANLNTGPASTLFPFVSADLTSNKGILYGINRHNNSLILFDRFSLENANMVVFAKSGSGKSYTAKLEILRSMMTGADVIVIDPENEYQYLAETVGGSFFKISLNSPHHINPFDLPMPLKDESPADVLRSNIINMVGLVRLMLGGLTPEEDAIIDRAIAETYASRDITPEVDFSKAIPPTMSDFRDILASIAGGASLATRLEKYISGTYAGFLNNQTNIDVKNKLVIFSIRDMETELRPIATYLITRHIWNLIRAELKKRILVIDEAWVMMQHEDAASFVYGIAKRCRKYYLGLTTITQDVADFMQSKYGKAVITNSSIQLLLKQSPATIEVVKETFNLTDEEKYLLLECDVGEGIFFAGLKHAAIKVIASYTEDQIITSNPEQLLAIEKAKKEME